MLPQRRQRNGLPPWDVRETSAVQWSACGARSLSECSATLSYATSRRVTVARVSRRAAWVKPASSAIS